MIRLMLKIFSDIFHIFVEIREVILHIQMKLLNIHFFIHMDKYVPQPNGPGEPFGKLRW